MEKTTHLMVNGFLKEPPKELFIIEKWLYALVQEINEEIKAPQIKITSNPTIHYVDKENTKDIVAMCIIDTGYVAMRIWEKEKGIFSFHFDIVLSSPLPGLLVVYSIAENLGMYDGTRMVINRGSEFELLGYRSYP